jgi:hypothetical protein
MADWVRRMFAFLNMLYINISTKLYIFLSTTVFIKGGKKCFDKLYY